MIGRRYLKWEGVYEKYSTVTKKYSTVMIITVEYGKFVAIEYTKISGVICKLECILCNVLQTLPKCAGDDFHQNLQQNQHQNRNL